VAHSLSAKKRIRQNIKRRARNRARKEQIKEQVKSFNVALTGGDMTKAEAELRKVASRLDRVAAKGTIHKNTAARKRSRLARRLNAVRSGAVKATAVVGGKAARGGSKTSAAGTGGANA
jgi:small subunit ribosomal protein S20